MRTGHVLAALALVAAALLAGGDTARIDTPTGALHVTVADTPAERREGLMNRSAVPLDGMLFVYQDAGVRTFWMKHTRVPLDMVFIAGNGTVVNVERAVPEPGATSDELARYRSDGPVRYVLEIPAGDAARHGIRADAVLDIER